MFGRRLLAGKDGFHRALHRLRRDMGHLGRVGLFDALQFGVEDGCRAGQADKIEQGACNQPDSRVARERAFDGRRFRACAHDRTPRANIGTTGSPASASTWIWALRRVCMVMKKASTAQISGMLAKATTVLFASLHPPSRAA